MSKLDSKTEQLNVLLVESDRLIADMYATELAKCCRVSLVSNAQEAVDVLDSQPIDVLITDVLLGSHDGVEIIHEVRSYDDWLELPIIVLSSLPDMDFPLGGSRMSRYGIFEMLYKPTTKPEQLLETVLRATKKAQ